jgi:hypothetical protein
LSWPETGLRQQHGGAAAPQADGYERRDGLINKRQLNLPQLVIWWNPNFSLTPKLEHIICLRHVLHAFCMLRNEYETARKLNLSLHQHQEISWDIWLRTSPNGITSNLSGELSERFTTIGAFSMGLN